MGSYNNENKSFSIFLLLAVVVLAFLARGGSFLRLGGVRKKEEEEFKDTITSEEIKVLFNRSIGKEEDLPQEPVVEEIAQEGKDINSVLYSRVIPQGKKKKATESQPESKEESPAQKEEEHTVLYSRKVNASLWSEKPYIPYYSRSVK